MSDKNIAVKVEHVSKFFKLPTEASQSLRTTMVNRFKGIKGYKEQHVLKDISFEVEKGDRFPEPRKPILTHLRCFEK